MRYALYQSSRICYAQMPGCLNYHRLSDCYKK